MSDVLEESRKYFQQRLSDCQTRPGLHTHQIPVYQKYLQVIANSANATEYTRNLGPLADMFAVMQAEQMDKYMNLQRVHEAIGANDKAEAARDRFNAAKNSKGHADLYKIMGAEQVAAAEKERKGYDKVALAMSFIDTIIAYQITAEKSVKKERANAVVHILSELQKLDAGFSFESYKQVPYSYVCFFDNGRMAKLRMVLEEILNLK